MGPETVDTGGLALDGEHTEIARWGCGSTFYRPCAQTIPVARPAYRFHGGRGAAAHEESANANAEARATCSMTSMCPSRQTGQARKEIPVRAWYRSR